MILLIDTSTPLCKLLLVEVSSCKTYEWQADRKLAKGLLGWLKEKLTENDTNWSDVSAIGVFEGPGSFTGLRIGMTVMNTLAESLGIPIVGARGDKWVDVAIEKVREGRAEGIVLPYYGGDAHITAPRK